MCIIKKQKTLAALIMAISLWMPTANAQEPMLYAMNEFYPYLMPGKDGGEPHGVGITIVKMVFKQAGVPVKVKVFPYARVQNMARNKETLFFAWGGTREEADSTDLFTRVTTGYVPIYFTIYHKKDVSIPAELSGYVGKKMLVIRNWSAGPFDAARTDPNSPIKVDEVGSVGAGIKMLSHGRGDYLLGFEKPFGEYLKNYKNADQIGSTRLAELEGHVIVLSRFHPMHDEMLPKMTQAFEDLFISGALDRKTGLPTGFDFSDL